jgi:hypothetical protein
MRGQRGRLVGIGIDDLHLLLRPASRRVVGRGHAIGDPAMHRVMRRR